MDVKFDPILGKMREADIGGGTGGGGTTYIGGNRIDVSGETISFVNSADIVNVTGTSVTLQPDTAYKMYATTGALNVTANPPAANKWAYEGHAEIFVGSVGYVVFDTSKIVLANALEPDSVNNCTLRFHDGVCIIAVEDHVAGYIVVNGSTSGNGSLYYGISTSTNDYVAFDASLNGTTIPIAGAVAEGEKHVVGNGYAETTITGAVACGANRVTVANLSLSDVQVTGGTMTIGDASIPSGSTVSENGGFFAIEKLVGSGTLALMPVSTSTRKTMPTGGSISGVTITGATNASGNTNYMYLTSGNVSDFTNVFFTGMYINGGRGTITFGTGSTVSLTGCTFSGNHNAYENSSPVDRNPSSGLYLSNAFYLSSSIPISIRDCTFDVGQNLYMENNTTLAFSGTNILKNKIAQQTSASGSVRIASGAIVDLTGNANATPIYPGGSVIVDGGCTVITSAGTTVSIAGGTYTKINSDGTTA